MRGWTCFFMALAAFLAGVIVGSRFLPSGGSTGCGNKIREPLKTGLKKENG